MAEKGLTANGLGKINSRHQQTLENIRQLQNMEKDLYTSLDTTVSGRSISTEERQRVIGRINELSQMRMSLYKGMKDMYLFLQTNIKDTRNSLVNDITNIGVVEGELNNAKRQLKLLEKEKYDKLRMVEINTYHSERYAAQSGLMKIIILTCIPLLIVAILKNKGFIPENISNLVIAVIAAIGIILFIYSFIDIMRRDNMNFQAYDYGGARSDTKDEGDQSESGVFAKDKDKSELEPCVGKDCCTDGMIFNPEKQECQDIEEGMVGSHLVNGTFGATNDNIILGNKGTTVVMPFADSENYATL